MTGQSSRLTLDQSATYKIKVPGVLDLNFADWVGDSIIEVESEESDQPITVLTCTLDQAALHGLLRRLYTQGLPIISVQWIDQLQD